MKIVNVLTENKDIRKQRITKNSLAKDIKTQQQNENKMKYIFLLLMLFTATLTFGQSNTQNQKNTIITNPNYDKALADMLVVMITE